MPSRAAYRARQAAQALFPRLGGAHVDQARALLSGGEMALFLSMAKRDQRHGLRVMEHLRREGQTDQDLLAAALLHDCGKGDVPVWLRAAYVLRPAYVEGLAKKAAPRERLPRGSGEYGWCLTLPAPLGAVRLPPGGPSDHEAAYRLVHHVRLGAEAAAAAGAGEATVRYISGRAGEHEHAKIALLRAADDRS